MSAGDRGAEDYRGRYGGDRRGASGGEGDSRSPYRGDRGGDRRDKDRIPAGLPDLDALQVDDPARPKLKLAPRGSTVPAAASSQPAASSARSNPFGDAKPRELNLAQKAGAEGERPVTGGE